MNIDKFYQVAGYTLKRLFNYIIKPVKNFNVDNRAQKAIKKQTKAPWHDTTNKLINELKKDNDFIQQNEKNDDLLDRLKSVKVDDLDLQKNNEYNREKLSAKLPRSTLGATVPFVFQKPEKVPPGKILVLDTVDILLSYKIDNQQPSEIAERYNLSVEDVELLLRYVDIFKAFDLDGNEVPIYKKFELDSLRQQLESYETTEQKQIEEK